MDQELLESCEVRDFKKGDIILRQTDEANGMYVIKAGNVQVLRDGKIMSTLTKGDFFGEMAIMLHEPRCATIRVSSDELSTYYLSIEKFDEIKKEVGEEVIRTILERTIDNCKR